jgi:hypothetical protein
MKPSKGFTAHGKPALTVLARLDVPTGRKGLGGPLPQNVGQSEGKECSVEANREPTFGETPPAAPTGQRDRFRPPQLTLSEFATEGRTGLPMLGFDHLRVPARLADPSAACADRTLRTCARFPAVGEIGSDQLRCRTSPSRSQPKPTLTNGTCGAWTPHRAGRARGPILSTIGLPPLTGGAGAAAVEPSRSSIKWGPRRERPSGVPKPREGNRNTWDGKQSVRA